MGRLDDKVALIAGGGSGIGLGAARCPLAEGRVDGTLVTCPWHDSQFDVATGQPVQAPAQRPVPTYRVKVDDGTVFLAPREVEAGSQA